MKPQTISSELTGGRTGRGCEIAELLPILRRKATRNVPMAGFLFTIAFYLLFITYSIGTTTIGNRDYIPVVGLAHLALAICFLYAGIANLFIRTTDKALYVLIGELVDQYSATANPAKPKQVTPSPQTPSNPAK